MLNTPIENKSSREILMENSKPILFDSGNPFGSTQTLLHSDAKRFEVLFAPKEDVSSSEEPHFLKMFYENQLRYTLSDLSRFGDNVHILNNTGLLYFNQGSFLEAEKYFKKAIDIKHDYYPAMANLAKLYLSRNRFDEALSVYNDLTKYFPEDLKVLQNISHVYIKKHDLEKAFVILTDLLQKDNKNASAYNNLGVILILRGEFDKAIAKLRLAISLNINFANAYNNIGVCYSNKKEHKKAINYYLSAISLNKNFHVAFKNIAHAYQETGDYLKAKDIINVFLNQNKPDVEIYDLLAFSSYSLKKYDNALIELKNALKLTDETQYAKEKARLLNNLGVVHSHLKNIAEAEKHYTESISITSEVSIAFENLIQLYLDNNRLSKAKTWIEKAKEIFTSNYDLLIQEGKYHFMAEEYDNACEPLKQAITINPKKALPYALLNSIYTEIYRKYDMAVDIAKEGLKYDPKSAMLLNNLAYTYLLNDNLNEAREILSKTDEHNDVYLTATKGLLLVKEGKVEDGEYLYNRAATLVKDNKSFYNQVHQKKYLELGKYYMRTKDMKTALNYFKKAVGLKTHDVIYKKQAVELSARLKGESQG